MVTAQYKIMATKMVKMKMERLTKSLMVIAKIFSSICATTHLLAAFKET